MWMESDGAYGVESLMSDTTVVRMILILNSESPQCISMWREQITAYIPRIQLLTLESLLFTIRPGRRR